LAGDIFPRLYSLKGKNMPRRNTNNITANEQMNLMSKAMSGDMVMAISPATVTGVAATGAWTRKVIVSIKSASGEIHQWLNAAYTTTASIAKSSVAGTATIPSTTLTITKGVASITVTGSASAWLAADTDTLSIGNITVLGYTVTGGTSVETFA
jgi:hypothetical protein